MDGWQAEDHLHCQETSRARIGLLADRTQVPWPQKGTMTVSRYVHGAAVLDILGSGGMVCDPHAVSMLCARHACHLQQRSQEQKFTGFWERELP